MTFKTLSDNGKSNKGYSLIEVLIAVIILSIVVIPLLTAFILSAKLSKKAKSAQLETTVAQTVMEDFKNTSIEKVFDYYTSPLSGINASASIGGLSDLFDYKFERRDINVGGITYRTEVLATAQKAANIIEVTPFSATFDYAFVQSLTDESEQYSKILNEAASKINEDYNYKNASGDYVYGEYTGDSLVKSKIRISRNITIKIERVADKIKVSNSIQYKGKISGHPGYNKTDGSAITIDDVDIIIPAISIDENDKIYPDDPTLGKTLENVYIYYFPAYKNGKLHCDEDKIEIVNDTGEEFDVYLIKQLNPEYSEGNVLTWEGTYSPTVNRLPAYSSNLRLHSNIKKNISPSADSSTPPVCSLVAIDDDMLYATKSINTIYDLEVNVYDQATDEFRYRMNGSMESSNDK